jgi:hypothetical protein
MPFRNSVVITSGRNLDGVRRMGELVQRSLENSSRWLSLEPLRLDGQAWAPYEPDEAHAELFASLREQGRAAYYSSQKELLDDLHKARGTDIFVASYQHMRRGDGPLESYAVWSKGVDTLLPVVDLVVLVQDGAKPVVVAWSEINAVAGALMQACELVPQRVRVREFPAAASIDALRRLQRPTPHARLHRSHSSSSNRFDPMPILTALSALLRRKRPPVETQAPAETPDERVLGLLGQTLIEEGFLVVKVDGRLRLASGIELQAEFLECAELSNGNVRTATRIVASHGRHFPKGVPEYQHSAGRSAEASIVDGFKTWSRMDLATLEDALRAQPQDSTLMEMKFPATQDGMARTRRVVLGPTAHYVSKDESVQDEEHPFCPCCLVTQSIEAFQPILQSDETVGIRLFASIDADGEIAADCRINGEDYPKGVEHLVEYVRKWPRRPGLEYRKQYVVVRSVDADPSAARLESAERTEGV